MMGRRAWLAALTGMSAPAHGAMQDIRLDTRMFVERVQTDINGQARRIVASTDRPVAGDQLIVVLDWRHGGNRVARGLFITRPVPQGAEPDLSDPAMQVSIDNGAHWGRMDQLWLPTPLGGTRRATPADITHIRWPLPAMVGPGQAGRLSYRATIR